MENKCEKCFYYKLCVQHDYIIDDESKTNNYCGIVENGIPLEIWNNKQKCKDYKKA